MLRVLTTFVDINHFHSFIHIKYGNNLNSN